MNKINKYIDILKKNNNKLTLTLDPSRISATGLIYGNGGNTIASEENFWPLRPVASSLACDKVVGFNFQLPPVTIGLK